MEPASDNIVGIGVQLDQSGSAQKIKWDKREREEASETLTLRHNVEGEIGEMSVEDFREKVLNEIADRI